MTDPPTAPLHYPGDRWELIWSHRDELLKIACSRSMSGEDAEDAVQEAMLRAVENQRVRYDRLGAWLTAMTVRLCVTRHRQVAREAELREKPALSSVEPVPVEEAVCDRAEAQWLVARSAELPARQAAVLQLKSQNLDVGQVARKMGLSYQAAESLLARARRTLREGLTRTLALGVAICLCARRLPRTGAVQSAAFTSTAMTLAVVGLMPPAGSSPRPDAPRPGGVISRGGPTPEHPDTHSDTRGVQAASGSALSVGPHRTGTAGGHTSGKSPGPSEPLGVPTVTVSLGALVPTLTSVATPISLPSLSLAVSAAPSLSTAVPLPEAPLMPEEPSATSAIASTGAAGLSNLPGKSAPSSRKVSSDDHIFRQDLVAHP